MQDFIGQIINSIFVEMFGYKLFVLNFYIPMLHLINYSLCSF